MVMRCILGKLRSNSMIKRFPRIFNDVACQIVKWFDLSYRWFPCNNFSKYLHVDFSKISSAGAVISVIGRCVSGQYRAYFNRLQCTYSTLVLLFLCVIWHRQRIKRRRENSHENILCLVLGFFFFWETRHHIYIWKHYETRKDENFSCIV